MKTVLLTSVGGLTGTYLTKLLSSKFRLIGADMGDNIPLSKLLNKLYKVPASKDPDFIHIVKQIVINENVDYIIPVSSYDMNIFSKFIGDEIIGNKMFIVDNEINNRLHNKENCYYYLNEIGISTPKITEKIDVFPILMKPKIGSGSKDIHILRNNFDLDYWEKVNNDYILIEYLEGSEFTVDCLFDSNGDCKGYNIRERQKMAGGGATVTQNCYIYETAVKEVINKLEKTGILRGAMNFQFKIKNNTACVFDFNTRFASGGLPVTVASGFNIPEKLFELIETGETAEWSCPEENKKLKMMRYYDEVFI